MLGSCVTCSACALFIVRYTFLSALDSDGIEISRKCVNSLDNFCYVCGEITFASRKRVLTPLIKLMYFQYFDFTVGDHGKS